MAARDGGAMEFRDFVLALRRHRWLIVLTTMVVVGTALALSFLQPAAYEAGARVLIERDTSVFGANTDSKSDPAFVQTEMQVIQSEPVRAIVRSKLGLRAAPTVSTSVVGTTSIVDVSAQSTSAKQASAVANAYVAGYIQFRTKKLNDAVADQSREIQGRIDAIQRQVDGLGSQLSSLPPCPPTGVGPGCTQRESMQQDRDALVTQLVPFKQRLDQLRVDASAGSSGAQLVTPAAVPTTPVQPRPVRNGLLGLGVGLLGGLSLALLLEYLDDSIRGKEDLERCAPDVASLALIPTIPGWKDRGNTRVISISEPSSPFAEAYRTLRTSIRFLAVDRPLRVIQITSPSAGEGKTTTTANLGVVLARAGERVAIVSCDLRRPRLHEFFGLSNEVGFTSVLLGETPLSSALQRVTKDNRLWLLASGPLPPNPSELLSSDRASEVLAGLRAHADIVLIDCPPVLPVTDSVVLSAKVDGTLMVVTSGSTTRKQLARSVEVMRQVGAPLVGAVLNGASAEGAYGYTYSYYARKEGQPKDAQPDKVLDTKVNV